MIYTPMFSAVGSVLLAILGVVAFWALRITRRQIEDGQKLGEQCDTMQRRLDELAKHVQRPLDLDYLPDYVYTRTPSVPNPADLDAQASALHDRADALERDARALRAEARTHADAAARARGDDIERSSGYRSRN